MQKGTRHLILLACTLFFALVGVTAGLAQQTPVIKAITSAEPFEMLVIGGEFGPDPGPSKRSVTVGGVTLNITKWEENTIQCDLPLVGPGSAGDVVVTTEGRKSNARKLVEWRGQTIYTVRGKGSLMCTVTGNLRFRGDPESLELFQDLTHQEAWMTETKDSTLNWSCSGNERDVVCPQNVDGYFAWGGSGTLAPASPSSPNGFSYWVSLDNKTGEVAFLPFPVIYDAVLEKKIDCDDGSTIGGDDAEEIDFEEGLYDDSEERVIIGQMDSNYTVQAGNRGPVENQGHPTIGETAEFRWTTFTSTYAPTDLRAKPKVASTVVRGETLTLDGSESTGDIKEYKWTFAVKESGAKANTRAQKKGAMTTVILLSSMDVTLTVSDGKKKDKKTVTVTVLQRSPQDWTVPFELVQEEGTLDAPCPSDKGWIGGANVCADDLDSSLFHPHADKGGSWSRGYEIGQVNDPNGPFDMWWYSKASKLSIKRKILVNKCILENTNIAVCTEHFYDANVKRGGDVDNYLKAVRQHEKMHSDLVKEALPGNDPAKKMEALYDKTENNLKKKIDKEIKKAEDALDKATKDPLDEIWSGTLFVPDKNCNWKSIETDV